MAQNDSMPEMDDCSKIVHPYIKVECRINVQTIIPVWMQITVVIGSQWLVVVIVLVGMF
jgi:hypothetical protein